MQREQYFKVLKEIRETYKTRWKPQCDPYGIYDWLTLFTPIERNIWSEIRYLGLPFYPQYPIGPYWVDFADPVKKIAIEVDGNQWHLNAQRDVRRSGKIENTGWRILRITGRQSFIPQEEEEQDLADVDFQQESASSSRLDPFRVTYFETPSEEILKDLKWHYYKPR